jgi:simple sugar transport system ATP-binding protein
VIPAAEVRLSGITKRFATVTALDSVDFAFQPGRVHALLGENGAGKSTLMGVAFGLLTPDAGSIAVGGEVVRFRSPRDAIQAGIGMVQQHFSLVPALTVAENVAIGERGRYSPADAADRVRRTVEAQQRVEIVRALARGARTLVLDEPTAVLAPEEASTLLEWLREFARAGGAVALVTHKVAEALSIADDVSVLRGGRLVAGAPAAHFSIESLARAMFPEAPDAAAGTRPAQRSPIPADAPVVVAARNLDLASGDAGPGVSGATFIVRAGEIVGVAGVEGAGHALLLRALAGVLEPAAGELRLPTDVSFVPGDRHRDAVVLEFPLFENVELRHVGQRSGLIDWPATRERTAALLDRGEIRAPSVRAPLRTLSGGNQQRFVLARELESAPALLVAENPTRGLDLQATAAIHERLLAAAAAGAAVVLYSSDLDEVLILATRVLVAHQGQVREVAQDRSAVARAMVGEW